MYGFFRLLIICTIFICSFTSLCLAKSTKEADKTTRMQDIYKELENFPDKDKKFKVTGDLHVVCVYEGAYDTPRGFMEEDKTGNVNILIKTTKPITLLLSSYHSVNWNIKTDQKANIKKIYYSSCYDSKVNIDDKNIPIEKIEEYADISNKTFDRAEKWMDKKPKTLQYKYSTHEQFVIDGKLGNQYSQFPKHKSTDKEVELIPNLSIKLNDKLEAYYDNRGASSSYLTNKYYKKGEGRYYFEAAIEAPEKYTTPFINTGIISPWNDKSYCDFVTDDEGNCISYGALGWDEKLADKDVIGVAIDFNKGKIYFSKNGKWLEGAPGTKDSGIIFKNDGREYTAAVETSDSVRWKMNFGSKKFKYKIPKGYKPYDTYSYKHRKIKNNT